jgi:hypothetical protein
MSLPGGQTCATCVFWKVQPFLSTRRAERSGQCRCAAPVALHDQQRGVVTRWPLTQEQDWCGDHAVPDTG